MEALGLGYFKLLNRATLCLPRNPPFLDRRFDSRGRRRLSLLSLGSLWAISGPSLGCPWAVPGLSLECPWAVSGVSLGMFLGVSGVVRPFSAEEFLSGMQASEKRSVLVPVGLELLWLATKTESRIVFLMCKSTEFRLNPAECQKAGLRFSHVSAHRQHDGV